MGFALWVVLSVLGLWVLWMVVGIVLATFGVNDFLPCPPLSPDFLCS